MTRALLWLYGRLWVRRSSTKQAFLCDDIEFSRRDGTAIPPSDRLEAGNRVRVTVAVGESRSHARRSAVRCAIGSELVLAIVTRTDDKGRYRNKARCITVRHRSVSRHSGSTTLPARTLEWDVIGPAGSGPTVDRKRGWSCVPHSALWLICHETAKGRKSKERIQAGRPPSTVVPFYASGSNSWRGFGSALVRTLGRTMCIGLLVVAIFASHGIWNGYSLSRILTLSVVLYVNAIIFKHLFSVLYRIEPPAGLVGGSNRQANLPWHGATIRSLAIGDRLRNVGLSAFLGFQFWEPTKRSVRSAIRRLG